MKPLSDNEIRQKIIEIISSHLADSKIILFGSRAKGTNRERSDYDVAIIWKEKIPSGIYSYIQEELDNLYTLKTIDLIDFYSLETDFQEIVEKEGCILYDRPAPDTTG